MINAAGLVIYIGKAKNLKNRISSYFVSLHKKDLKTQVMVKQVTSIDTIATHSEIEALILESQLIKTFKPRFNIMLKDDKSYPYIKVTVNDLFPKIQIVRQKYADNAAYFGPYPSIGSSRYLQKMLYDCFPIRECKQAISLTKKEPKCLLLDIGRCIGPCVKKEIKPQYDQCVHQLLQLLTGKDKTLMKQLKQEMNHLSETLKYEEAAKIRDKIDKINRLFIKQSIDLKANYNAYVWGLSKTKEFTYVVRQEIVKGKLLYQTGKFQENTEGYSSTDFFIQCILDTCNNPKSPKLMWVPDSIKPHLDHLVDTYTFESPQKGIKKDVLDGAKKNAFIALNRLIQQQSENTQSLNSCITLQKSLDLTHLPKRIMGFDISHLQGSNIVASSVYFKEGKPYKNGYKKFSIKTVSKKSNDPKSMYEVVLRRLSQCQYKQELLPNLLLIDGGRAQLNYALKAIADCNLLEKIEVISLAKREEEVYTLYKKKPILLLKNNEALRLLQYIRDESHRFAVTFQRKKHNKQSLKSILLSINGIGPKKIIALYQHFKTIEAIMQANSADIIKIKGLGKIDATRIKQYVKIRTKKIRSL